MHAHTCRTPASAEDRSQNSWSATVPELIPILPTSNCTCWLELAWGRRCY